jgi:hypothetical protein
MLFRFAVICVTASAVLPTLKAGVDSSDKSEPTQVATPNNIVPPVPTMAIPRPIKNARLEVDSRWEAAWKASCAFHGAGSAFDAYTSYHRGPYESNALLRDANGQFGNNAVLIKAGSFAAISTVQWAVVRKWPQATKFFIPVNAVLGGTYFYLGRRNQQFLKTH